MDLAKVEDALAKIDTGLKTYLYIMHRFREVDVSKDCRFQTTFNGFYRMRSRKPEFYHEYYECLETNKNSEVSFAQALKHIYEQCNRIEASFCSKLVATINPNLPIWDKFVLTNLGLKAPTYACTNRIEKCINLYDQIQNWYSEFLTTDDSKQILYFFDAKYPSCPITDIKKIDLILWQMR